MFIGREKELQKLHEFYTKPSFALGFIYGRRRVGKSELVKQSLLKEQCPFVYYQCEETSEAINTASFLKNVAASLSIRLGSFTSFAEALDTLLAEIKERKVILVIDEYPYLRKLVRGLDSQLQKIVDKYSSLHCQAKLILLGSYVHQMMEVSGETNGPLRDRGLLKIDLGPLDYYQAKSFFPSLSDEGHFEVYSVFGGVPFYLKAYQEKKSLEENIEDLILDDQGLLHEENQVILEEISNVASSNVVLSLIASGIHNFKRLNQKSGLHSSAALSWVLHHLQEMSLIRKDPDLFSKVSKYTLSDSFLLFYYRYLFKNASASTLLSPKAFYDNLIQEDFYKEFLPYQFEALSKDYLIRCSLEGKKIFFSLDRATYQNKAVQAEFDIVGKTPQGDIFYECKYEKTPLTLKEVHHLEDKVTACRLEYHNLGFFTRKELEETVKNYLQQKGYEYYSLKEMYH